VTEVSQPASFASCLTRQVPFPNFLEVSTFPVEFLRGEGDGRLLKSEQRPMAPSEPFLIPRIFSSLCINSEPEQQFSSSNHFRLCRDNNDFCFGDFL